jgi:hypothetical protein
MHPAPRISGAMPALERDGAHVVAFLVVKHLKKSLGEAGANLG